MSDRTIFRHESGKGSVIRWTDRDLTRRKTLVMDARYRRLQPALFERMTVPETLFMPGTVWPRGHAKNIFDAVKTEHRLNMDTEEGIRESLVGLTDEALNGSLVPCDTRRSRENTDMLLAANPWRYSPPSVCRKDGWDLPDIQTVLRIYASMDVLDGLDPTVDGDHMGLIGWMSSWSRFTLLSSSMTFMPWGALPLVVLKNGNIESSSRTHESCGIVPVLDL